MIFSSVINHDIILTNSALYCDEITFVVIFKIKILTNQDDVNILRGPFISINIDRDGAIYGIGLP